LSLQVLPTDRAVARIILEGSGGGAVRVGTDEGV